MNIIIAIALVAQITVTSTAEIWIGQTEPGNYWVRKVWIPQTPRPVPMEKITPIQLADVSEIPSATLQKQVKEALRLAADYLPIYTSSGISTGDLVFHFYENPGDKLRDQADVLDRKNEAAIKIREALRDWDEWLERNDDR